MNFLKKIYREIIMFYDRLTSKECFASVGDLLHKRNEDEMNQLLSATRYCDVENYIYNGNETFIYQNTVSRKAYGEKHLEQRGNEEFKALIESYKKSGYNENSVFTVDSNLRLMDGNHRMALNLFFGYDKIKIRVLKRNIKAFKNTDWFYEKNISSEYLEETTDKLKTIRDKLTESGNCFVCVFSGENDLAILDLKRLAEVSMVDKTVTGTTLVRFTLKNPEYCVFDGYLKSLRAEKIEKMLKLRYPEVKLKISMNCLEGKELFDSIKKDF